MKNALDKWRVRLATAFACTVVIGAATIIVIGKRGRANQIKEHEHDAQDKFAEMQRKMK